MRLSLSKISAALTRANRRDVAAKAAAIQQQLRTPGLRQPPMIEQAYAVVVTSQVRLIDQLNVRIAELAEVVAEGFGRHPDADIVTSQPGLGAILGARVLANSATTPSDTRTRSHARTTPGPARSLERSGTRTVVLARYARNEHLADAIHQWAFCALTASPGARAYYDQIRARGANHHAALRQLGNRLVGILHGCLKTRAVYDEHITWPNQPAAAA